ncbi:glycoside hydrolase family 2 TIM barrel-domain containing protein [Streptomyces ardesiacus]|uniref:glycoside hydrolase family 2 TIM barrel-domain containing protein n=1 Tax=Streptomyces ardesiacus TaxID=285564 RepID=UPI003F4A58F1
MSRQSFNHGWAVKPKSSAWSKLTNSQKPEPVTLPHDALIGTPRSPDAQGKTAYFASSVEYEYTKTFFVPPEWRKRRVSLEFQGAYRDAMVYVNGVRAAHWAYGYSTFTVTLDDFLHYDADNSIRVEVRAHDDSRWYSGAGLFRDVILTVTDLVHISHDGITVTTPEVDDELAVVEIAVPVTNAGLSTTTVTVDTEIRHGAARRVASDTAPLTLRAGETGISRRRMYVTAPRRWSVDHPYLYEAKAAIRSEGVVTDEATAALGIRTLRLDPYHGLRINGDVVKLRGACVHHDNGILGAAAIGRAEERRVELLKEAGFNAIRSAHTPLSQAMLDACDRLGMLVMDEAFDVWTENKSPFDYASDFDQWWERDIEAMVRKDRNHPSVVLYSTGNEIPETGTPLGAALGRRIAEKVRSLDNTRPITSAVNGFVSALNDVITMMQEHASDFTGGGGVNAAGDVMGQIAESPMVAARIEESLASLDVAGLNYAEGRYEIDRTEYPNRLVVGTETFPPHIAHNWKIVENNSHVLGDFTWTGWDYLGETGIGRMHYVDEGQTDFEAPYPWLTAWCGDHDITGYRRPQSYYREIVFGLRTEPYIAVQRPEHHGRETDDMRSKWAWVDSLSSWSWPVDEGTPLSVEVYSPDEEVELLLNGTTVGRRPVGRDHDFRTSFDVNYARGELVAVSYRGGRECARTTLRSAGRALGLDVRSDRSTLALTDAELAFVSIELRDQHGALATDADCRVEVTIQGAGVLQGLGTGRFDATESFRAPACKTFDGRALAVIRPTEEGEISVTVSAEKHESVTCTLRVGRADGSS